MVALTKNVSESSQKFLAFSSENPLNSMLSKQSVGMTCNLLRQPAVCGALAVVDTVASISLAMHPHGG